MSPRLFQNNSLDKIDAKIKECLESGNIVIAVFDTDITARNKSEQRKLTNLTRRYANNENVILCDSFPSIEFWFLLHFIATTRYYSSSKDVINALQKYIPEFSKTTTFLRKDIWVKNLLENDGLETAIANSSRCASESSYSNIPLAINLFDRLKN